MFDRFIITSVKLNRPFPPGVLYLAQALSLQLDMNRPLVKFIEIKAINKPQAPTSGQHPILAVPAKGIDEK